MAIAPLAVPMEQGMDEVERAQLIARRYRADFVDLKNFKISHELFKSVPVDMMFRYNFVPLEQMDGKLAIAVSDPSKLMVLDEISGLLGQRLVTRVATLSQISELLKKTEQSQRVLDEASEGLAFDVLHGDETQDSNISIERLTSEDDISPIIRLVDTTIFTALERRASDIHLETFDDCLLVKYRIDGVLQQAMAPIAREHHQTILSRIKVMSELDIAERRVPQDGRIKLKFGAKVIDYRVSTLPVLFGEKIVLRILDKGNLALDLTKFGFEPKAEQDLMRAILNPYGMVLVTGPTGSGKTTTLYSALSRINQIDVNIMTAEDPVEYNLMGINQVLVRNEVGMTFAAALKAFLRQDPNIIMVGEIRDLETGSIAIKAALTGHLVLSTLHTNDAPSTVTRMVDMGIEPFNVASAVNLIVAQRLVRRVCVDCKQEHKYTEEELHAFGIPLAEAAKLIFYKGTGCDTCNGSGYKGRQGLYEVMAMTSAARRMVLKGGSTEELREQAVKDGMLTLRMDGMLKVKRGITTLEEVVKETAA
jgi:type IV-A pilus assembly ATPase PilB